MFFVKNVMHQMDYVLMPRIDWIDEALHLLTESELKERDLPIDKDHKLPARWWIAGSSPVLM